MTDRDRKTTKEELRAICGEHLLLDEPMRAHTSFRIGGPADYFVSASSKEEIARLVRYCRDSGLPWVLVGNGSNILVADEGYRGLVIRLGRDFGRIEAEGETVRAEAGALLSAVASEACAAGLAGFEFAAGIPGTIGGACMMNAGAYGGEMKQVLVSAEVLGADGVLRTVCAEEMGLSYRHSAFMERGDLVLGAELRLKRGQSSEIRARMEELKRQRVEKQPLDLPSAGSTFKRPEGYFAGKLIMDAGLRGYTVGGAQVSEKHCGFVVNRGGATAEDVHRLISDVQERVWTAFGVKLEPEVQFIGGAQ